jgi:hypothetical protein
LWGTDRARSFLKPRQGAGGTGYKTGYNYAFRDKTAQNRRANARSGVVSRSAAFFLPAQAEGSRILQYGVERITQFTESLKDFHEPQMRHRRLA